MLTKITLENIGLRYGRSVVIRSLNHSFNNPSSTAVSGSNGSGKSSLLKIISGNLSPTSGQLSFQSGIHSYPHENTYSELTYAAPYVNLPEQLTFREILSFCSAQKEWRPGLDTDKVIGISGLEKSANKRLSDFSSGMKQRVKLVLAILQKSSLMILDEPTTNLDRDAKNWYLELLKQNMNDRLVIIASNETFDLQLCNEHIQLPS